MFFLGRRNPLMRQSFKKSNSISHQDVMNIIKTFNNKLDQLNTTLLEVRNLLDNGISYNSNNQQEKTPTTKNQNFYVPDPDIRSIKSSNKEREKNIVDSTGVSDTLDSLNDIK